MKGSLFLKSFLVLVLILFSKHLFAQDTIFRLNRTALIGIIKLENDREINISTYSFGKIRLKKIKKSTVVDVKRGNTTGYFTFNNLGVFDKKLFKTKIKSNWKSIKKKERKYPDTLALIDRAAKVRMYVGIKKDSLEGNLLYYRKPGRTKVKSMELEKIYSVNYSNVKSPLLLYVQDTLEGNWYTTEQMKDYMHGQNDAYRNYKRKARTSALGGMVLGLGSSATGFIAGPFLVIGFTALKGYSKPKFKSKFGFNEHFKDNVYYQEGFGTMAKRLTIRRVAAATLSGYVLGIAGLTLLLN
jgi:hypothetical protein